MEIESSTSTQSDILHEREDPEGLELDIYIGLHNGYPITQIDCSPKMKYVATLSEFDRSVALWSIDPNQQSLRYENIIVIRNIYVGSETSMFTVSDDGYVAVKLVRLNPCNFEIYDLKTTKISSLHFPYLHNLHKNISHLSFINNGNLVMVSTKENKAYILFPNKTDDDVKWICQSIIELKNFSTLGKIYITPKRKLIIFQKKVTCEITTWNLETLSIEAQILLNVNFNFECIGLSDDAELLGIAANNSELTYLYIFSTKTGMNLSTYTYEKLVMIDGIHFIASNVGERVLITSHVHDSSERIKMDLNVHRFDDEKQTFNYQLMDPYNLINPVNADKVFGCLKAEIKKPYIIKSDHIIYVNDEQLFIEKLVKDNWVYYLRNDLNDYNKISIPSDRKDIINFIKEVDSEEDFQNIKGYKGRFITWSLSYENFTFTLGVYRNSNYWHETSIKIKIKVKKCKVLESDDLVMITEKCVFLWTFNPSKGIIVHYIWGVGRNVSDKYWEEIFNNPSLAGRFLPQPDFDEIINANVDDIDEIIKTYDIELSESEIFSYLCNQLLKDYINEKFFLAYYGKILMEKFLTLNKSLWVEELFKNCIKKCPNEKDSYDLYSNIQFLNIITQCYSELIQKNPVIVHGFLSQMTFVVPSVEAKDDNVYLSSLSHLHYYGSYEHLHKTSFSIIFKYWLIFKNNYKSLFSSIQNHFLKPFTNYYRTYYLDNNKTIKLLFPLPHFANYPKNFNTLKELWRPEPSPFTKSIDLELYKTWNGEALLKFKWNTYGRFYYILIWIVYTIFLCCFTSVATLSNEISWTSQQTLLIFSIILGIWQFTFEFRQFIYSPILYITSPWNYIWELFYFQL
ncbi:hypothetical protein C2G38_688624 [Gigaspora rosea]|uniref:Ion transport domain-containing protein n=1 Tax=Gigaspora rosea TaxID=44941 RepID=A0A397W7S7_9GLOM|nr:hypothetical protein C2G38_688624 [Gigaspora rosea]